MNNIAFRNLVDVTHTEEEAKELAKEVGLFKCCIKNMLPFHSLRGLMILSH